MTIARYRPFMLVALVGVLTLLPGCNVGGTSSTSAENDRLRRETLQLRRDLERLEIALKPLARDRGPFPPPAGLAGRTLRFIAAQQAVAEQAPSPAPGRDRSEGRRASGRAWVDRAIIAATASPPACSWRPCCSIRSPKPGRDGPSGT
jgi:hypothetical protein